MKSSLYLSYPVRSLARGGQRTLLAIFCVAVGVLAIVALQLVGNMVNASLTGNVREGNGGDISINVDAAPLSATQLTAFDQLQTQGTITGYTAISRHEAQSAGGSGQTQFFVLRAVDPQAFPLNGAATFNTPTNGTLATALTGTNVVVTKDLLHTLGAHVGDALTVSSDDGRALHATIAGVIENAGYFTRAQMLVARDAYSAVSSTSGVPVNYTNIYVNVPGHTDAAAATAKQAIAQQFPLATVTTTKDALQQNQSAVQNIRYFLQVVGLLALLIGGVGIINTMQVLLRRRQTEIAMLKTAGYRQGNLYVLFGIEAGLLGLIGGIVGSAAGIGVSFLVKGLVEKAFFLHLPIAVDPLTVASGVVIGFATALIFGLMPIVQASQVRPIAVLRDQSDNTRGGSLVLSVALGGLLALLFFGLALSILQNLGVAIGAVVGTGLFLVLLTSICGAIVFGIGKLPVLERFSWWYLLLVGVATAASIALTYLMPAFGVLFLVLSLLGIVVVLLPRNMKATVRLALRNIGRQRARTAATLVALFVGIFAIGLVLVLGQNIKDTINSALSAAVTYNTYIVAGTADKPAVDTALKSVTGVQAQVLNTIAQDRPVAINGVPIEQIVAASGTPTAGARRRPNASLGALSSVEGYDLAGQQAPTVTIVKGKQDAVIGRALGPQDAGTANAVLPLESTGAPLNLKLGDRVTLRSADQKVTVDFTLVGFYTSTTPGFAEMFSDNSAVASISDNQPFYFYSLKVDPKQADNVLHSVQRAVPTVQTFSLVDLALFIDSLLNNLIVLLTAVASLALLAGIIIIANTVALAMLERQRELGILKAVGYTSRTVLSGVLLENGVVGFTGALLAMLLVTAATTVLGKVLFNLTFGIGLPLTLGVIFSSALVCMLVAAIVSWNATRVRPLEVLRYE